MAPFSKKFFKLLNFGPHLVTSSMFLDYKVESLNFLKCAKDFALKIGTIILTCISSIYTFQR